MVPLTATKLTGSPTAKSFEHDILTEFQSRLHAIHSHLNLAELDEAISEGTAYAFEIFQSAKVRGVASKISPCSLAVFCGGLWRTGRRFTGSSATDVLGERTRVLRRVRLQPIDVHALDNEKDTAQFCDVMVESKKPSPFDSARVNMDYTAMLSDPKVSSKARKVFLMMMQDQSEGANMRIAEHLGISAPRATQLKRELAAVFADYGYSC